MERGAPRLVGAPRRSRPAAAPSRQQEQAKQTRRDLRYAVGDVLAIRAPPDDPQPPCWLAVCVQELTHAETEPKYSGRGFQLQWFESGEGSDDSDDDYEAGGGRSTYRLGGFDNEAKRGWIISRARRAQALKRGYVQWEKDALGAMVIANRGPKTFEYTDLEFESTANHVAADNAWQRENERLEKAKAHKKKQHKQQQQHWGCGGEQGKAKKLKNEASRLTERQQIKLLEEQQALDEQERGGRAPAAGGAVVPGSFGPPPVPRAIHVPGVSPAAAAALIGGSLQLRD